MSTEKATRGFLNTVAGGIGFAIGGPVGSALAVGISNEGYKSQDKFKDKVNQLNYQTIRTAEVEIKEKNAMPALVFIKDNNGEMVRALVTSKSVYFKSPLLNAIQTFRLYVKKTLVGEISEQLKTAIYLFVDWLVAMFGFDRVMEENLIQYSSKTYYPYNKQFAMKIVFLALLAVGLTAAIFYALNEGGKKDA